VTWPVPWKPGLVLEYDQQTEVIRANGGEEARRTSTTVATVAIVEAGEAGYLQRWTWRGGDTSFDNVAPGDQASLVAIAKDLAGLPLDVRLQGDGYYEGLANVGELAPKLRAAMENALERSGGPAPDPDALAAVRRMFDAIAQPAVLEAALSPIPFRYNFIAGGGVIPGKRHEYDDEAPNPFGTAPIPTRNALTFLPDPQRAGWYEVRWTMQVDPEKGGPLLAAAVDRLVGPMLAKAPEAERDALMAKIRKESNVQASALYRVDGATGIVHRFELVQERRIGDRSQVETTTLALRDGTAAPGPKPADANAADRRACFEDGVDAAQAIAACGRLVSIGRLDDARLGEVLSRRGWLHGQDKDWTRALADLDAAIGVQPRQARAHLWRGVVQATRGEYDLAVADFGRAIALDPNDADAWMNRGVALQQKNDFERSLPDLERALALAPRHALALNARCWSRAVLGRDLDGALADCNAALEVAPESSDGRNSRGFVHFRRGEHALAIRDYDAALAKAPREASSHYVRGLAKRASGDTAGGDRDIRAGIALEPGVAKRYAGYGIAPPPTAGATR
jgi:tetratricopeptide (TPR) repeat protein